MSTIVDNIKTFGAKPILTAINGGYIPSNSRGNSTKNNGHLNKMHRPERRTAAKVARRQRAINSKL